MKMKQLVTSAALIVAMGITAPSVSALTATQIRAVKKAITSAPAPELPAKAAELVKKASKEDREAIAIYAVRAAIYKSRTSAPLVVSAVVKAAPDLAAAVTKAASEMESVQAGAIAIAAISAAPASKTEIVVSANQGVNLSNGGTPSITPITSGSVPNPTPTFTVSGRSATARGAAAAPAGATVTQSSTPINTTSGGNGSGSFSGAQANPAPASQPVDYTQPRT